MRRLAQTSNRTIPANRVGAKDTATRRNFGPNVTGARLNQDAKFFFVAIVTVLALCAISLRLGYVQIFRAPSYQEVAAGNRIRVVETPAPRGVIVDAVGNVMAGNRDSLTVTLDWEGLVDLSPEERREVFSTLVGLLDSPDQRDSLSVPGLQSMYSRARTQALEPVVVAEDISAEQWIPIRERNLAGISVELASVRTYPYGKAAGHILGYLGRVVDDEEADQRNRTTPDALYRPGSIVGRAGVEKLLESSLRGQPEVKQVEVDAKNRVVRTVEVVQPAKPGATVYLNIDMELQLIAEKLLAEKLAAVASHTAPAPAGSFVALNPRDGAVLALASFPAYDPSQFVFGLSAVDSAELDNLGGDPFLNRAVAGQYAPGSTFKPAPAYAAVISGARSDREIWNDEGRYRLKACRPTSEVKGCLFRNAGEVVLGPVALRAALTKSSDTYFYSLGEKFWVERSKYGEEPIQQSAALFGLGSPTGIELPGEATGRLPGPEQRRQDHQQYPNAFPDPNWYTGDSVNLSIGQGDTLATPVQLANMYATIANGGTRFQPRIVNRIVDANSGSTILKFNPRPDAASPLDPVAVDAIRDGLADVPLTGTAQSAFAGFNHQLFPVAAKTGTAEVDGKADTALFAGYGPADSPRVAFSVVLEEAGFGGVAAAPVARQFLDQVVRQEMLANAG